MMPQAWRNFSVTDATASNRRAVADRAGPISRDSEIGGGSAPPAPCGFMPPLATNSRSMWLSSGRHSCCAGVPPLVCTTQFFASPPRASASSFGPSARILPSQPSRRAQRSSKDLGGFEIAPFQFQTVGAIGTEHAFFPGLEGQPGAVGKVAALDAEIVDALGEIEHVIAFEAEIVKRIHATRCRR